MLVEAPAKQKSLRLRALHTLRAAAAAVGAAQVVDREAAELLFDSRLLCVCVCVSAF